MTQTQKIHSIVIGTATVLLLVVWNSAWAKAKAMADAVCPVADLGETAEDCPWGGIARTLQKEAEGGKKITPSDLQKLAPALARQMRADAGKKDWKNLWGTSINYDEYAKGMIVDPAILKAIGKTMAIPSPLKDAPKDSGVHGQLAHAGMEHTYGYLFSTLKTPFGYKRARWVHSTIESGFGLPDGLFGPATRDGSLFSNVTYFAGRIAFRDIPAQLKTLKARSASVPKALRDFPFDRLQISTLEETVNVPDSRMRSVRPVVLRTDLVAFTQTSKDPSNTHLLVYSIQDPEMDGIKVITAFPVATSFLDTVFKAENLGENKPVITRYNGYVEGLTGKTLTGTRKKTP